MTPRQSLGLSAMRGSVWACSSGIGLFARLYPRRAAPRGAYQAVARMAESLNAWRAGR